MVPKGKRRGICRNGILPQWLDTLMSQKKLEGKEIEDVNTVTDIGGVESKQR